MVLVGDEEQALLESQTNGAFNGFSQRTLDILNQAVAASEARSRDPWIDKSNN